MGVTAFHEKAGWSQVGSFVFSDSGRNASSDQLQGDTLAPGVFANRTDENVLRDPERGAAHQQYSV